MSKRARSALRAALLLALAACHRRAADPKLYYAYDGEPVVCSLGLDDKLDFERLGTRLQVAADEGWVLNLYAHVPGDTISRGTLERVLAMIDAAHLPYVTYASLADLPRAGSAGVALAFDDSSVDAWYASRDQLAAHHAVVTYFVSGFAKLTPAQRGELHALASAGHDIESHTVDHLDAADYAKAHGVAAYVADQVVPEIDALRADGYAPRAFAYPFGSRSAELDAAILQHAAIVRSTPGPCPR